jgi:hypothetical protein
MSKEDFEVEEYTINVLPFTAANASIESVSAPIKPGMKPVTVSAVSNFLVLFLISPLLIVLTVV